MHSCGEMVPDIEPIAGELQENRRLLRRILARLREEELEKQPSERDYSPRQVLAHLAGAERGMTRLMKLMAAGEKPRLKPDYDNDYYNLRQQEKRAKMNAAEILAELEGARSELIDFIENMKEEDLAKSGEHPTLGDTDLLGVLNRLKDHEREHVEEMGAWADKIIQARV